MSFIAIAGAGAIGGALAHKLASRGRVPDVRLIDADVSIARGKALAMIVLGLLLGFLNIVPYLGNIIGLGIGIPLAYFQDEGGLLRLGLVLLVFVIVQCSEGYLLTPKIMGDRTGLHPMVIIVAIFFWGSALGGIAGMILAIPLTAFLVVFWRLAREHYIGELV